MNTRDGNIFTDYLEINILFQYYAFLASKPINDEYLRFLKEIKSISEILLRILR